jgi:adenylosuccinate lyase
LQLPLVCCNGHCGAEQLERCIEDLPMRGVKGTTGTQATFLQLFDGDHAKVKTLNKRVCELMGFDKWISVSGQTYTRKVRGAAALHAHAHARHASLTL